MCPGSGIRILGMGYRGPQGGVAESKYSPPDPLTCPRPARPQRPMSADLTRTSAAMESASRAPPATPAIATRDTGHTRSTTTAWVSGAGGWPATVLVPHTPLMTFCPRVVLRRERVRGGALRQRQGHLHEHRRLLQLPLQPRLPPARGRRGTLVRG